MVGQMGRDLVLRTDGIPQPGGTAAIVERRELLGGKGANQALGLRQLGVPVALVGVVGDDEEGSAVMWQAFTDGIDVSGVARRGRTSLMIDLIDADGARREFEDYPAESFVTVDDVRHAGQLIDAAEVVSIQLQQPPDTALAAAHRARRVGARVVADGVPGADALDDVLRSVNVLRADACQAERIAGATVTSVAEAKAVTQWLLTRGPSLVSLSVPDVGDLLAWPGGSQVFPCTDVPVVDRTGADDAFVAGLVASLRRNADPVRAGRLATAAARTTVQHLGGRPDLSGLAR